MASDWMYPLCTQEGHNIKEAPKIILSARVKTTSKCKKCLEKSKRDGSKNSINMTENIIKKDWGNYR